MVVAVTGSVVNDPLVGCTPLQPPEAMQVCALLALQFNVTE